MKRLAKLIAKDISAIVGRNNIDGWYLAAVKKINTPILENLRSAVRIKLKKNISSNLTKTDKTELLGHFA